METNHISPLFVLNPTGLPDLAGMMLATIEALNTMGGSANLHELDDEVAEMQNIQEKQQAYLMPDGQTKKLKYYLSWARTYLKRGNALENSKRGVWSLTEKGKNINSYSQTKAIYEQVNNEERQRAKNKRTANKNNSQNIDITLPIAEEPIQKDEPNHESDWQSNLIKTLCNMTPSAFERLSKRLLREAGFVKVEVRGKTGDGGIDGVGVLRVNLVSFQVYFQCKKWKGSVGSKEIRDFRGALQGRADKGLFITTGNFTAQASEEATRDGAIAIDLIDGERLCELLKQYELGVQTRMVEQVLIEKKWFEDI